MKRVVVAAAVAAGLLVASAVGASACAEYCEWDPLVLIVTPAGNVVPVYDSVWTQTVLQIGVPVETYTVEAGHHGNQPVTNVTMTIYVPAGTLFNFSTFDEVTTGLLGSGSLLASGYGYSGSAVQLYFTLPEG